MADNMDERSQIARKKLEEALEEYLALSLDDATAQITGFVMCMTSSGALSNEQIMFQTAGSITEKLGLLRFLNLTIEGGLTKNL